MPKTKRKKMGKAHNKSPPNAASPIEEPNKDISLEGTQDMDLRRTIINITKGIKEYKT